MSELEEQVDEAQRTARRASRSPIVRGIGRSGYVASGLLRGLIGVLALLLGTGADVPRPGTSGAFGTVGAVPGGVVLLALIAGGDGALLVWLLVRGFIVREENLLERWRQRLVLWGRAVVYGAIGVAALRFALGAHAEDDAQKRQTGRQLFEVPGGQLMIAAVGAVVVVVGVSMVWLGLSRRFEKTIELPADPVPRRAVVVLGAVAYLAQGATIALVGGSLLVAAWTLDPGRVGGLDAALAGFAASAFEKALLLAIGVGWIVAGLYALLRARLARND